MADEPVLPAETAASLAKHLHEAHDWAKPLAAGDVLAWPC